MRNYIATMFLFGASLTVNAQTIQGDPYVAVEGIAQEVVVPDRFPVSITLSEVSFDSSNARDVIESLSKQVVGAVESLKVDPRELKVSNIEVSSETDWDDDDGKEIFRGNRYERKIKVVFPSQSMLGEFISRLPEARQLQMDTTGASFSNELELRRKLTENAIADAKETAQALANGAGMALGGVHTISNRSLGGNYSSELGSIMVSGSVTTTALLAPGTVKLREGSITISQRVYIVFRLLPQAD